MVILSLCFKWKENYCFKSSRECFLLSLLSNFGLFGLVNFQKFTNAGLKRQCAQVILSEMSRGQKWAHFAYPAKSDPTVMFGKQSLFTFHFSPLSPYSPYYTLAILVIFHQYNVYS